MHGKLDAIAGYLGKLTAAGAIRVEPSPEPPPDLQIVQGGLQ